MTDTTRSLNERPGPEEPPHDLKEKCMAYRRASKMGFNSIEGMRFCEKILKRWPDWYACTQQEVYETTKPFGSDGI